MTDATVSASDGEPSRTESVTIAPQRDEESLLHMFIGRNSEPFARLYRRRFEGKRWLSLGAFNWIAALFGVPWFFYRKLYIEGTTILTIPIVLVFILPTLENLYIALSAAVGALANLYYVQRTLKKIKKIEAMPLPPHERNALIRTEGGTSNWAAILGTLILAGLAAIVVAAAPHGSAS